LLLLLLLLLPPPTPANNTDPQHLPDFSIFCRSVSCACASSTSCSEPLTSAEAVHQLLQRACPERGDVLGLVCRAALLERHRLVQPFCGLAGLAVAGGQSSSSSLLLPSGRPSQTFAIEALVFWTRRQRLRLSNVTASDILEPGTLSNVTASDILEPGTHAAQNKIHPDQRQAVICQ
jgi:hypothetical protein